MAPRRVPRHEGGGEPIPELTPARLKRLKLVRVRRAKFPPSARAADAIECGRARGGLTGLSLNPPSLRPDVEVERTRRRPMPRSADTLAKSSKFVVMASV